MAKKIYRLRMPFGMIEALRDYATRNGTTVSATIRQAVSNLLRRNGYSVEVD